MLNDQDYTTLMRSSAGREAFAVFVALILVGRQRLTDERATQIGQSDALRLEDGDDHLERIMGIKTEQLESALNALEQVASANKSKPWAYRDDSGRIVIRSFFKFNVHRDWGGPRPNSGPKRNQAEFKSVQVESNLKPSCVQLEPPPSPSPSPTTYSSESRTNTEILSPEKSGRHISKTKSLKPDYERHPEFERFWNAYPSGRKSGKPKALEAWKRAVRHTDPELIVSAAERYAASPVGQGEFVKMPATWLNGGCWDDDPAAWGLAPKRASRVLTSEELRLVTVQDIQNGGRSDAG